jgi:membrane associated rhomboid family serine protease
MLLIPPIPIKAKYFVAIFGGIELFTGVTGSEAGVAHFAHIGGMVIGFILIELWGLKKERAYY